MASGVERNSSPDTVPGGAQQYIGRHVQVEQVQPVIGSGIASSDARGDRRITTTTRVLLPHSHVRNQAENSGKTVVSRDSAVTVFTAEEGPPAVSSNIVPPIEPPIDRPEHFSDSGEPEKRPEPLTDERAAALIASEGNSEVKAAIISLMRSGEPYTGWELYKEVKGAQEGYDGLILHHQGPEKFCENSFITVGHVVKVEIGDNLQAQYSLTEEGDTDGKALAGWLMKFSEDQPVLGLYDYFGGTNASHQKKDEQPVENDEYVKRAPYVRLKLYRALAGDEPPESLSALARTVSESVEVVARHLKSLRDAKIVTFKTHTLDQPKVQFMREDNAPVDPRAVDRRHPNLVGKLLDVLPSGVLISSKEATDLLVAAHKDSTEPWSRVTQNITELDQDELRLKVSRILSRLTKLGVLTRKDFGTFEFTGIAITADQQEPVGELISIVDRFKVGRQDFLDQGREFGRHLIGNAERTAALLKKAKKRLPSSKRQSVEVTKGNIVSVAEPFSDGMLLPDIQTALEGVEGRKLKEGPLRTYVSALEKAGILYSKVEHGSRKRYFVTQNQTGDAVEQT